MAPDRDEVLRLDWPTAAAAIDQLVRRAVYGEITAEEASEATKDVLHRAFDPARCTDGTFVHDFKGQRSCPSCGFIGIRITTEGDSTPPRDDNREPAKSVYFGRRVER